MEGYFIKVIKIKKAIHLLELPFSVNDFSAETKGFEPLIELPLYTLSRRAPSATRTRLHKN